MVTSSHGSRKPASVARPSGGNKEYLIGRNSGLVTSVNAGSTILTFTCTSSPGCAIQGLARQLTINASSRLLVSGYAARSVNVRASAVSYTHLRAHETRHDLV